MKLKLNSELRQQLIQSAIGLLFISQILVIAVFVLVSSLGLAYFLSELIKLANTP